MKLHSNIAINCEALSISDSIGWWHDLWGSVCILFPQTIYTLYVGYDPVFFFYTAAG